MKDILYILYLVVISCNAIVGALQYKKMDKALRIFYLLIVAIFLNEVITYFFVKAYKNASPVSHVYSIFELALITIYFLYTIFPKPKTYLILLSIICSIVFELIDMSFQKIEQYNNYMIVVESLLICPQALYVLYMISNRDDITKLSDYPHFYIWRSILIWWSVTFFYWEFLISIMKSYQYPVIHVFYIAFNDIIYILILYTLLRLKRKTNVINLT